MFELTLPWWELMCRAVIVYIAVLIMVRVSGKRTIGQFSPFDVIVLLLLSEAAQGALVGQEHSVPGGLLVVATLIALNWLVAFASARNRRFESMVEGDPVTLIRDGVKREDAIRRNNILAGDLAEAMRANKIRHISEVEWAVLEPDGNISFFKRERQDSDDDQRSRENPAT
jgi:uncharacterized membrane protein YcaP (DUF421 family)